MVPTAVTGIYIPNTPITPEVRCHQRFLVKLAITVVTLPVVFHSFPLPVTHVFFFAVLLRNPGGITVEPRQCHCGHGAAIIGGRTAVLATSLRGQ